MNTLYHSFIFIKFKAFHSMPSIQPNSVAFIEVKKNCRDRKVLAIRCGFFKASVVVQDEAETPDGTSD
jgi:hypothetical protein